MTAKRFLLLALWGGMTTAAYAQIGPDVIVGDLWTNDGQFNRYGLSNGTAAYAFGTISCNVGDKPLRWIDTTIQHPVIAQNLYRLKDGRFEQLGMSWLKHGFFALSRADCFNDCRGDQNGCVLGVHCSDPYSADLNGLQCYLGPRWQVNPSTGEFVWPTGAPDCPVSCDDCSGCDDDDCFCHLFCECDCTGNCQIGTIARRLQVRNDDLNPNLNADALYFAEGHYITADDALAGNQNNNVSYRRARIVGSDPTFNIQFISGVSTQRTQPAILAWLANDPEVQVSFIDVPNDGRMILASKAVDLGGGRWSFEYALYNMNSHRAGRSFTIPLGENVQVTNVGFHDVPYHSGDGENWVTFSGQDWKTELAPGSIKWQTSSFDSDPNGNALRWGSLYNFRFEADAAPGPAGAEIGLYRSGDPGSMSAVTVAPGAKGAVPCSAIKKFIGRCQVGSGRAAGKIVTYGSSYNGLPVTIAIDGQSGTVTITDRKAKYARTVSLGDHVVELTDPAGCKDPITVTCE